MKKLFTRLFLGLLIPFQSGVVLAENPTKNPTSSVDQHQTAVFEGAHCHAGLLVFKVKPEFRDICDLTSIRDLRMSVALEKIHVTSMTKKFPKAQSSGQELNRYGRKPVDLSLVYKVEFDPAMDIQDAIRLITSTGLVVYCEPVYLHDPYLSVNDPSLASQSFITRISAPAAWDITTGDTNVVIGIVDSGTDWDHPDLQANIKYNSNDPIDGVDNDGDGFTDNYRGWDVSQNDNNPMVVAMDHGSHVSGCADAVTNNGVGVASPGFNCKFLPVKSALDASTSTIDDGYDGVIYAADHGVDIINCSWGRTGSPSSFEQDIIDHVTDDLDVLVVAAAGNNGTETDHFPASYNKVISVASTGTASSADRKSTFSNYGYSIDVCAPGYQIYSTVYNNSYVAYDGTSMASPVAAGCAAMIKSRFPWMNALQVGEQLRITCDNIYTVSGNAPYTNKLGKGRVNLFKAVTDSVDPGVVVQQITSRDNNDNVIVANDTVDIIALFQNLLRPSSNLVCTLSSTSTYVTILSNTFNAGVMAMMDTASNYVNPYKVLINPSAPLNAPIVFKITMTDGTWSDYYMFRMTVNVDYINITINDVGTSITSKGLIGYNNSGQLEGIGFTYNGGPTMLYEMGLMIGAQGTQVSDNVRGYPVASYDADFQSSVRVVGSEPGTISDFDAVGEFQDNGSTSTAPLNLFITHHAYAWTSAGDRNYIMVQYSIRNGGTSILNNLYAGIFADWDIDSFAHNKCATDLSRQMGYVWSTDPGGLYGGIKLLTHNSGFNHYGIDNFNTGFGGADLSDGFDSPEKYLTLSTNRLTAGDSTSIGNDVIDVVSNGPFNIPVGDSINVAFALIAGQNLATIQNGAENAQIKFNDVILTAHDLMKDGPQRVLSSYPNPANKQTSVSFVLPQGGQTKLELYSLQGQLLKTCLSEKLLSGTYTYMLDVSGLEAGSYMIRFESGSLLKTMPLTVIH